MTAAVLAIDGGNSKTEVALVGADGSLLALVRGSGSNHQTAGGRTAALAVLRALVREAAEQAGLPAGEPVAAHTSACLAGADFPDEEAELCALLHAQGWSATSTVLNDSFAVLRAGADDQPGRRWGIGVVCGSGMNCVGVAPDGTTTRFLALGSISGDWGGGGDIGRAALWHAARAEDGRGPQTALRRAVPAHFGLAAVQDVIVGLYRTTIGHDELRGLAPLVFDVAAEGDEVAVGIAARQADEVCASAAAIAGRLTLTDLPVPVVLGGSVLAARNPLLTALVTHGLAASLPLAQPRITDVPPVIGAALLGLDQAGAPPAAAVRLRAAARTREARVRAS